MWWEVNFDQNISTTVCLSRICQGDVSDVYSMFINDLSRWRQWCLQYVYQWFVKVTSVMSTVCLSRICQGDVSDVYSMFIKDLSRWRQWCLQYVYQGFVKVMSVMSTVCLSMICQGDVSDVYSIFINDLSRWRQWCQYNFILAIIYNFPIVLWNCSDSGIFWFFSLGFRVKVFNATCNNISAISWRSVLLVEETGVPEENHRPAASHWQTFSHNVVLSTPRHERGSNSQL
jgi:hypothetical protein